jgi:hypothetical protein
MIPGMPGLDADNWKVPRSQQCQGAIILARTSPHQAYSLFLFLLKKKRKIRKKGSYLKKLKIGKEGNRVMAMGLSNGLTCQRKSYFGRLEINH